ncbi:hypothetical protein [Burkholderia gladioli]|uniref:hypothetical protein n=1 Tax=Burkholderia gladioli TaxID=28095 RepID=UPI001364BC3B|nr:hypothetical protein [Burkholderia gladioli]
MTKPTPSLKDRQSQYHDTARSMTERAPWLFEHDDRAVACKDSGLLFSWEYRGRDPSEASEQDLAHVAEHAQRAFLQLRDRPSALWFTVRRRRAYDYPSMRQPDAVTQKIDDRRAAAFRAGRAYTNRYYMSALMLPSTGSAAFFERLRYFTVEEEMSPLRAAWFATRSMFAARDAFAYSAAQLDVQAARQMKLLDDMLTGIPDVQFQPLRGERRLAFLQNAYPRNGREVGAVASPGESWLLDAYLPDQYFYPGHNFRHLRRKQPAPRRRLRDQDGWISARREGGRNASRHAVAVAGHRRRNHYLPMLHRLERRGAAHAYQSHAPLQRDDQALAEAVDVDRHAHEPRACGRHGVKRYGA